MGFIAPNIDMLPSGHRFLGFTEVALKFDLVQRNPLLLAWFSSDQHL